MPNYSLSVNFAGLKLKNPLIVTASDVTRNVWQLEEAEKCGASAVILKAVSIDPKALKSKTRFHFDHETIFGFAGSKRLNCDEAERLIKNAKKTVNIPIGVNIIYSKPDDLDRYLAIVRRMQEAGTDFIEINFFPSTMRKPEGIDIPKSIYEGVKAVKQIATVPIITKLTPEGVEVAQAALAMEKGGADAIHAIDAVSGSPQIDIYDKGKLLAKGTKNCVLWLSGEYIRPIAQAAVIKVAKTVKIPVLGTGGITNWRHAIEMIMFGATATGLCTVLMIHGFEVLREIEKKMGQFMEETGFNRLEDFRGIALKNILSYSTDVELQPVSARVNRDLCNGCGLCVKPAHCGVDYRAIRMIDGKAEVQTEQCLGCGSCSYLCPTQAISMV